MRTLAWYRIAGVGCVMWAKDGKGVCLKTNGGRILHLTEEEFEAFVGAIKSGALDHLLPGIQLSGLGHEEH